MELRLWKRQSSLLLQKITIRILESSFLHKMLSCLAVMMMHKVRNCLVILKVLHFRNCQVSNDDTTLWDLREHTLKEYGTKRPFHADETPREISEVDDSASSAESPCESESCSEDLERKAEIDGERNSHDLVAPSDLSGKECFRHVKSRKLHFVGKSLFDVKFFKCGRKCNANYEKLTTLPAFAADGCLTCFGCSQNPEEDSSD